MEAIIILLTLITVICGVSLGFGVYSFFHKKKLFEEIKGKLEREQGYLRIDRHHQETFREEVSQKTTEIVAWLMENAITKEDAENYFKEWNEEPIIPQTILLENKEDKNDPEKQPIPIVEQWANLMGFDGNKQ